MCPSFSRQRSKQNVISPSDLGLRASAKQIKFTFMPGRDLLHLTSAPSGEERIGGLHLLELHASLRSRNGSPCMSRAWAGLIEQSRTQA